MAEFFLAAGRINLFKKALMKAYMDRGDPGKAGVPGHSFNYKKNNVFSGNVCIYDAAGTTAHKRFQ
jgi:hypothetical protein